LIGYHVPHRCGVRLQKSVTRNVSGRRESFVGHLSAMFFELDFSERVFNIHSSLDLRQFTDVPVSAECLDKQNAGIELSAPDIDVILFVAESRRL
jgi:hypothetical protein